MKVSCCRKLTFESAHRLYPCTTACRNCHGHGDKLFVYARNKNNILHNGMVVDFSVLKEKIGTWIDDNWDHALLYCSEDEETCDIVNVHRMKTYAFPFSPTAENMAAYLLEEVCPELFKDTDIEVFKIQLYETENCFAEVEL